jgi:hypothetical protein
MCSGSTGIGHWIPNPRSRPSILPLPVDSPAFSYHGNHHSFSFFSGVSIALVIEHTRPHVRKPRVCHESAKPNLLKLK